jgi:hypothetical protein
MQSFQDVAIQHIEKNDRNQNKIFIVLGFGLITTI